jgi:hypothetical protein
MSVGRISGPLLRSNLQRTDDLAFETDLLYINHSGNKIGINTDSPTRTLQVNGVTRNTASITVTNSATFGNMLFENASISALTGPISITAGSSIQTPQLRVGDVYFNDNVLGTYTSNTDLQLQANAAGYVDIPSNLEVYGSINATGNIVADGNMVIGDDSTDSLTIAADIDSDIIPDLNSTYNIGSSASRQWGDTFAAAGNVAGNIAVSSLVSIGGITVNLPIDNTYYVSSLGLDTNPGQTVSFAFATVEKALLEAAAAGGNNLIHILPGVYTEDFPLTLPANTTIRGSSLRAVKIQPTTSTQSEDAFLLNDGCMITDITVANFYYDSLNNTGHAFRFVNNINITAKSPYVQNVSVITQGSITSGIDPKGFAAGDAGRGALVDGSVANSASNQASMLFNAVTFITPGVDAVTMKNGVRVEFIDCFTYFANRSLYAINGAAGFASLGTVFGAEVRAIASASVYGNTGAEADGDETLMYLINHNMAYVGAGKDVTNDRSLAVQSQETVELNSGRVYYQSQDHDGNFRVGDTFSVDFSTGFINLSSLVPVAFTGSSLTVGVPGAQTFIDGERIILPNFTVSGNTIKSDINQVDIASASGTINFLTNTNISVNLDITGNLTVGGSLINFGDQITDTIDFEMEFTSDIIPATDNVYNLGSVLKNWDNVYTRQFEVGDITITDNVIAANQSNLDLVIQANGTGHVVVDNLQFKTVVDSTVGNINIANSTRTTNFTGQSIQLPTGNAAQRPTVAADLRYNSVSGQFEGYNTDVVLLGGVKDLDGDTRIELNSDEFYFYANAVNTGRIDTAGNLIVNRFHSQSQFALDNNTVTVGSVTPGTVAALTANGTGVVQFDTSNYVFNNGSMRNTGTNSDIQFQMTGVQTEQYVHWSANSKGVRLPYGTTAERNPGVIGELYWNTTLQLLQVYDGTVWGNASGVSGTIVPLNQVEEINVIYELILA